jgi:hypothetical protein
MRMRVVRALARAAVALLLTAQAGYAQGTQPSANSSQSAPVFGEEELDAILAPIALYPDELLAQVLMASTYPLEIVQAERWAQDPNNANLAGDQLAAALEPQPWDPSVKSLVPFPQVLQMMSEKLDWTQKLGDAFLAQQQDVMNSIQYLRAQAQAAGSLKTTEQQVVTTQAQTNTQTNTTTEQQIVAPPAQTIIIQPASPQIVYVPVYNPTIVYGVWRYPAYPPYYYPPPPRYYPGTAFLSGMAFAAGVAVVGNLWGWGNCNWGHSSVNINVNRYNQININNINAGRAKTLPANSNSWQHDPTHRKGVAYRDPGTRQQYLGQQATPSAAAQNFRGFSTDQGAGAANGLRGNTPGTLPTVGSGQAAGAGGGLRGNTPTLPTTGGGQGAAAANNLRGNTPTLPTTGSRQGAVAANNLRGNTPTLPTTGSGQGATAANNLRGNAPGTQPATGGGQGAGAVAGQRATGTGMAGRSVQPVAQTQQPAAFGGMGSRGTDVQAQSNRGQASRQNATKQWKVR